MAKQLRALEAARELRDEVNRFLDHPHSRPIYGDQVRESAQSIAANIREGFGRQSSRDRRKFFGYAVSSAEETDEHLNGNWRAHQLDEKRYWFFHNRIVAIIKMIKPLME
ncbi:MAG TPA: four helix bundle protein [Gemmatimonadaceae bacterium]|nr:four helix bundle protein [Gemmatimonadaceae bacterium]